LQLILILKETIENTAALIEIVRIYSHRDSPPSDEIVESLTEMGFEETAVLAALKKTGNNKASACEWLCDNRSGSVIELREGLAPDSPILKVILEMPQVQMTLSNPKTFLGKRSGQGSRWHPMTRPRPVNSSRPMRKLTGKTNMLKYFQVLTPNIYLFIPNSLLDSLAHSSQIKLCKNCAVCSSGS